MASVGPKLMFFTLSSPLTMADTIRVPTCAATHLKVMIGMWHSARTQAKPWASWREPGPLKPAGEGLRGGVCGGGRGGGGGLGVSLHMQLMLQCWLFIRRSLLDLLADHTQGCQQ